MNRRNPKKQTRKGSSSPRNQQRNNGRSSSRNHSNQNQGGSYGAGRMSSPKGPLKKVQLYTELTTPIPEEIVSITNNLDPFALFCACYLGIQENNTYRQPRLQDAARMVGAPISILKQVLKDYALDIEFVNRSGFELSLAKLDIKVAPEGINKFELAKELYKEYRELVPMPLLVQKPDKAVEDREVRIESDRIVSDKFDVQDSGQ